MVLKRYVIFRQDGEIQRLWRPKVQKDGTGKEWITSEGEDYYNTGRWHHFYYRRWQSLFLGKGLGLQKLWTQGNPVPIFLGTGFKDEIISNLNDTARAIHNVKDFDNPEKLMRPRKVDLVLILLVGFAAFGIGIALGGRI